MGLVLAYEMRESMHDDAASSMTRKQADEMVMALLKQALEAAVVGADKHKSSL